MALRVKRDLQSQIDSQLQPIEDDPGGTSFETLQVDAGGDSGQESSRDTLLKQIINRDVIPGSDRFTRSGNLAELRTTSFSEVRNQYRADSDAVQKPATPKVLYVVAPDSLFGHKTGDAKKVFQAAGEGASIGGALGSVIPGVGNIVGTAVGGVISAVGNLFKGDQRPWFDVVFKDALQDQLDKAGVTTTEPYSGKLTQRSQFKVTTPMTREQVMSFVQAIAGSVAKKMDNRDIRNGLAGIRIQSSYDKNNTLFSFEVKQPEPTPKQKADELASTSGKSVAGPDQATRAGFNLAGIILIVLAAGFFFRS